VQLKCIASWPNVKSIEWTTGIPSHYPPHVHNFRTYAWKSLILNETLQRYSSIFWLDAGSTVTGPLTPIVQILEQSGIFLVQGQYTNMDLSHPGTWEWLGQPRTTIDRPHYSGNTQVYTNPSRYVDLVVRQLADCAMEAACIAPNGNSLHNCRYDQMALSILAYSQHIPHFTEYLASSRTQLTENLITPSDPILWTSRQSNNCYYRWEREQDQTHRRRQENATELSLPLQYN
jgi:hypothetical protein